MWVEDSCWSPITPCVSIMSRCSSLVITSCEEARKNNSWLNGHTRKHQQLIKPRRTDWKYTFSALNITNTQLAWIFSHVELYDLICCVHLIFYLKQAACLKTVFLLSADIYSDLRFLKRVEQMETLFRRKRVSHWWPTSKFTSFISLKLLFVKISSSHRDSGTVIPPLFLSHNTIIMASVVMAPWQLFLF